MGYERNDRRYGRDQGYPRPYPQDRDYDRGYGRDRHDLGRSAYGADRDRGYDTDRDRGYDRFGQDRGARDYGRQPQGYDYDDRGFIQRAGDEVRSWFGDEDAERRRQMDERYRERDEHDQDRDMRGRDYSRSYGSAGTGYTAGVMGGAFGRGTSDYGSDRGGYAYGGGRDRDAGYDSNYRQWRDRQVEALDRDYDEYRRENQSKFEQEFHGWRTTRQGQRDTLGKVREHQEVVGSDGQHVGTVDKVRGDRIILTKNDQDAHNHHHSIPSSWIKEVADKVTISKTAEEAQSHWRDEDRNSAIGGGQRDQDRIGKDHNLNRSFSGTY